MLLSAKIAQKQDISFAANWIKLRMHNDVFTHFIMPFSVTIVVKNSRKLGRVAISFVPTGLNEMKLERNSRKANVSLGRTHSNSSKLIPCFWPIFADFQNQVFNSNLNVSAKYESN